jgi:4-hydroxybenzoate polyprenyltransferase
VLRLAGPLAGACHPLPTVAVTALLTGLGRAGGADARRTALLAGAVLTGQLSIGWANDALDAGRDAARSRRDKPVATGALERRAAAVAAGAAAAACVPLSLALGRPAGAAHLAAVAGGWAYDLGLKGTRASAVPYAVSFALFPLAAHRAAPGATRTPAWLPVTGALLGCGAHLLNALPDLADDAATGVHSLPVSLGAAGCRRTGAALLAAAAVVPPLSDGSLRHGRRVSDLLGTAGAVALAGLSSRAGARRPFALALAGAGLDLALLVRRQRAWTRTRRGIPVRQPSVVDRYADAR